ncbi:hydrogenase expression/formation protein HypE [Picosynechococcus sp. PCC 8807]|uniref:hydrogenase expression/formation protein HypE n=1 Tax=Picosynechococcus sp. PCC 8807 TaxID=195248 RepID=UPI00081063BD|nr:hydrogenase expression/formation protein HypE [Picosynechococcus sp. PCC 8807]ANV89351.1 hydrogenase expression/formation protein HypE [Picosynechococcus sp. PCC 8807]
MDLTCPLPLQNTSHVLLAHGGGGKLMQDLIDKMFATAFGETCTSHDAAALPVSAEKLAFTTDSYVVQPLFFPGGDIGKLAIYGTVNDLAMAGARPLYLSVGFILEEGLPLETLWRVVVSMQQAAKVVRVQIVTGDTKVVERGKGDGLFINTSGIGIIESGLNIQPKAIAPGDAILVSGDLGRHGIAIMAQREGLAFESPIESDCAPLVEPVQDLLKAEIEIHCLRDITRGGLAAVLNELAIAAGHQFKVYGKQIPVTEAVRGACEIFGFDPVHIANEGRFVVVLPAAEAAEGLAILQHHNPNARQIGLVTTQNCGEQHLAIAPVVVENDLGVTRILERLSGEQLPRIC